MGSYELILHNVGLGDRWVITVQTLMTTRAPAVLETEGKNLEQRKFILKKSKLLGSWLLKEAHRYGTHLLIPQK